MSSMMKELKAEISRVSRREINKELEPVKRVNAAQRGLIADLRRQLIALQKEVSMLRKVVPAEAVAPAPRTAKKSKDARQGAWITGKGVRTLRKRLGVTQPQLAQLAGVSAWTVVNWESTDGKVAMRRKATIAKLQELRGLGKRSVAAALAKCAPAAE